jgi:hypothetical protein
MRMGTVVLSIVVAAGVTVAAPMAQAAPDATLTGRLTGAKLPKRGAGVIPMAALRLTDGVVVAGTYARPDGRFSLSAPPGPYAILAAVVPRRGKGRPLERTAALTTARAGRRSKLKATLKKRKRRARHSSTGHAAFVQVDYPVAAFFPFQAPPGDLKILERGIPDMLVTDIVAGIEREDCNAAVVERMRLAEVIGELRLQQDPRFDPSTRLRTDRLIANNQSITGTIGVSGGVMTITAVHTNQRTGRVTTVSQSGPADDVFNIEQALAPKLLQLICPHTPKAYNATFNGEWTSTLNHYTVRWSGSARVELVSESGAPPDRWPAGRYAQYALTSGTVHATLNGTRSGAYQDSCTVQGEADFTLPAIPGGRALSVQLDEDAPAFYVSLNGRGDEEIPYTETGLGCNQQDPRYPMTGVIFAFTPDPLTAPGPAAPLSANTAWDLGSGFNHYSSQFTFTPVE